MQKIGVTTLFSTSTLPNSRVLCLVTPDGQRTMRFYPGCSQEVAESFLHPTYFQGVKLVHLESYYLRNGDVIERIMQLAQAAGAQVSIDLSSFEIVKEYRERVLDLIKRYATIVFANEDEIQALTGLSPEGGCLQLQKICSIAVVLKGKEGCLVGHQGEVFKSEAFATTAIDTTGAGDLFASGFLYGYLKGFPLKVCARLGNRLGSAIVEVRGAELSEAKWADIHAFLQAENKSSIR